MTKRTLIPILTIAATLALADGSGTDYGFPSYDHPRDGALQDYYLQQAIIERYWACLAAGYVSLEDVSALTNAWAWSRSEYQNVLIAKLAVAAIITNFVNVDAIAESGTVEDYLSSHGDSATTPTLYASGDLKRLAPYTIADMLVARGAPLNYFQYTFNRSLKSAGHPVAITGITEVAYAGTHIPGGRESWYTYDYGKNALWTIVTNLWYIQNINSVSTPNGASEYGGRWLREGSVSNQHRVVENEVYSLFQLDYEGDSTNLVGIPIIADQFAQWAMIVTNIISGVATSAVTLASVADPCAFFGSNREIGNIDTYRADVEVNPDLGETNYFAYLDVVHAGEWNRTVNDWQTRVNVTSNTPPFAFDVFLWFAPCTATNSLTVTNILITHEEFGVSNYVDKTDVATYTHDDHGATNFDVSADGWIGDMSGETWSPAPSLEGWEVAYDDIYTARNVGGGAGWTDTMTAPTGSAWQVTGTTNCLWPDADAILWSGDYYGWDLRLGILPADESVGTKHWAGNRIITLMDFRQGYRYP